MKFRQINLKLILQYKGNVCCNISSLGCMYTYFSCPSCKHTLRYYLFRHLKGLAMTGFEAAHPWTGFEPESPHPEGRELPLSLHGALPLSYMALKIIVQEVVVNWRMVARLVVTINLALKGTLLVL